MTRAPGHVCSRRPVVVAPLQQHGRIGGLEGCRAKLGEQRAHRPQGPPYKKPQPFQVSQALICVALPDGRQRLGDEAGGVDALGDRSSGGDPSPDVVRPQDRPSASESRGREIVSVPPERIYLHQPQPPEFEPHPPSDQVVALG